MSRLLRPDAWTDAEIAAWEEDQDFYSAPALLARLTRGGIYKGRDLLWLAGWFKRRWHDQRPRLHPLARYQRRDECEPLERDPLHRLVDDRLLCRAVEQADRELQKLYA